MKTSEQFKSQMTSRRNAIAADVNVKRLIEVCSCSEADAIRKMDSNEKGLVSEDIEFRIREYGANILQKETKHNFIVDLFHRFKNPLVVQLLLICAISFVMSDLRSAAVVSLALSVGFLVLIIAQRERAGVARVVVEVGDDVVGATRATARHLHGPRAARRV